MNFNINIFFPISTCRDEIETRWNSLQIDVDFVQLDEHVRNQKPLPQDCRNYRPTFVIPAMKMSGDRYAKAAKCARVAVLETALAYCIATKAMVPKSTADLLASACAQCSLFDCLLTAETEAAQKRRQDRVKGGKARQERLRPAREYAFHLFRSSNAKKDWRNAGEAARAIYPQVKDFVIRNRLALVPGESLIRTIRGWLRPAFDSTGHLTK